MMIHSVRIGGLLMLVGAISGTLTVVAAMTLGRLVHKRRAIRRAMRAHTP